MHQYLCVYWIADPSYLNVKKFSADNERDANMFMLAFFKSCVVQGNWHYSIYRVEEMINATFETRERAS